jgi:hypothetical protein
LKLKKNNSFSPEIRNLRSYEASKDESPVAKLRIWKYRSPIFRTSDFKEQICSKALENFKIAAYRH